MIFFQILKILLKNAEMFCKTDKKKTSQPAGNQYFFFFFSEKKSVWLDFRSQFIVTFMEKFVFLKILPPLPPYWNPESVPACMHYHDVLIPGHL